MQTIEIIGFRDKSVPEGQSEDGGSACPFRCCYWTLPATSSRLSDLAKIITQPTFESRLIKIQQDRENDLTEEVLAVQDLKLTGYGSDIIPDDNDLLFPDRALKPQRRGQQKYFDRRFILPTSNLCKRLFSDAGYALGERRKGPLASTLSHRCF